MQNAKCKAQNEMQIIICRAPQSPCGDSSPSSGEPIGLPPFFEGKVARAKRVTEGGLLQTINKKQTVDKVVDI